MNPSKDSAIVTLLILLAVTGLLTVSTLFYKASADGPPRVAPVAPSFALVACGTNLFKIDAASGRTWRYQSKTVKMDSEVVAVEGWVEFIGFDESARQSAELLGRSK